MINVGLKCLFFMSHLHIYTKQLNLNISVYLIYHLLTALNENHIKNKIHYFRVHKSPSQQIEKI